MVQTVPEAYKDLARSEQRSLGAFCVFRVTERRLTDGCMWRSKFSKAWLGVVVSLVSGFELRADDSLSHYFSQNFLNTSIHLTQQQVRYRAS